MERESCDGREKEKKIYIRKNFSWEASSLDPVIYLSFFRETQS